MAGRPRLPDAVAKVSGAAVKNPQRFTDRKPPKSKPLGQPPVDLDEAAVTAWLTFAEELPWLEYADRTTLELASRLTAIMRTDFISMTGAQIGHLRVCLTEMGATPAARSKIKAVPDDTEDDPTAKYLL
jgi:phage terminase small subunit